MRPLGLGLWLSSPQPTEVDDGVPDGFEAVTQDAETVTFDGEPVYVAEE